MSIYAVTKERKGLEQALLYHPLLFSGAFMLVGDLFDTIASDPEDIDHTTIDALSKVLRSSAFRSRKNVLFLYRRAADCLSWIAAFSREQKFAFQSLDILKQMALYESDSMHRAVCEAIGKLPIAPTVPDLSDACFMTTGSAVEWQTLLDHGKAAPDADPRQAGRSFVFPCHDPQKCFTIKPARTKNDHEMLKKEAAWMIQLRQMEQQFTRRFDIPEPVRINNRYLHPLRNIPPGLLDAEPIQEPVYAIAFMVDRDYHTYPNQPSLCRTDRIDFFQSCMEQNAWLLGNLTASGIFHTAPIPLFHNRVQRNRRTDQGLYLWTMGGRLDQWLASSQYPNLGVTGLRDFEHLRPYDGTSGEVYECIGTHILSLILIIGSYFRNKAPSLVGRDSAGNPVDARHLFDPGLFSTLLKAVYRSYYEGFTGTPVSGPLPFSADEMAGCLIEKMGVDTDMEEILRYADIESMSDRSLLDFLHSRGVFTIDINHLKSGGKDLVLETGPHLGAFNRRISVPELVPFLETVSATCIAGRFETIHPQFSCGGV